MGDMAVTGSAATASVNPCEPGSSPNTGLLPVEDLRRGDELELPLGRLVLVERVDRYDDTYVVRWHVGPVYREPHPLAGQREQLGSLRPMLAGGLVKATRSTEPRLA